MADQKPHDPAAARVSADAVATHHHPAGRLAKGDLYHVVGLAFALALVYRYWDALTRVLLLAFAAATLAVVLNALRRQIPIQRKWVAGGIGLVVVGGFVGLLWWATPLLMDQARGLLQTAPQLGQQVDRWERQIQEATGFPISFPDPGSLMQGGAVSGQVLGRAGTVLETLLIPLILFFGALFALAKPNDRLLTPVLRLLPHDLRLAWYRIFQLLGERLIGWAKGTAVAMLAVGMLSTTAFMIIGVPNAVALGLFNGLVEFVPLAGPWIGGVTAVLVAFVDDPQKALFTAIAALAIQQIEANIITPWAMSKNAEMHPFVTLFSLVLFGGLFGFLGILLALPLVLLVWTVVQVLWVERAIDTDRDQIAPVVKE